MTDREMLVTCLDAFKSIAAAGEARKLLKRMGVKPGVYCGTGQAILRKEMLRLIRAHLDAPR